MDELAAHKPRCDSAAAADIASRIFGLRAEPSSIKPLDSYDDRNFFFQTAGDESKQYVLKIHNGVDTQRIDFVHAQNAAMDHLRSKSNLIWCPRAQQDRDGNQVARVTLQGFDGKEREHLVRCLDFLTARLQGDVRPTTRLLHDIGVKIANAAAALHDYDHPAAKRHHMWDLRHTAELESTASTCLSGEQKATVLDVITEFKKTVLPLDAQLRRQVIHADANDQNVLVDERGQTMVGLIDFGDMVHTWLVNELAIAMAYALVTLEYERDDDDDDSTHATASLTALSAASNLLSGFESVLPLEEIERRVLPTLVSCRLAMSLTCGVASSSKDPSNAYLRLTLIPGWRALQGLRQTCSKSLIESWVDGCQKGV